MGGYQVNHAGRFCRGSGQAQARAQPLEAAAPLTVECDDLAVQDRGRPSTEPSAASSGQEAARYAPDRDRRSTVSSPRRLRRVACVRAIRGRHTMALRARSGRAALPRCFVAVRLSVSPFEPVGVVDEFPGVVDPGTLRASPTTFPLMATLRPPGRERPWTTIGAFISPGCDEAQLTAPRVPCPACAEQRGGERAKPAADFARTEIKCTFDSPSCQQFTQTDRIADESTRRMVGSRASSDGRNWAAPVLRSLCGAVVIASPRSRLELWSSRGRSLPRPAAPWAVWGTGLLCLAAAEEPC